MIIKKPTLYKCRKTGHWILKREHLGPIGFVHEAHRGHHAVIFDTFERAIHYLSGKSDGKFNGVVDNERTDFTDSTMYEPLYVEAAE